MHKLLGTILILCFLIAPFRLYLPFLEYQINKQYIAENLCVNRTQVKMKCGGKCYLMQQIQAQIDQQQQKDPLSAPVLNLEEFCVHLIPMESKASFLIPEMTNWRYGFLEGLHPQFNPKPQPLPPWKSYIYDSLLS